MALLVLFMYFVSMVLLKVDICHNYKYYEVEKIVKNYCFGEIDFVTWLKLKLFYHTVIVQCII